MVESPSVLWRFRLAAVGVALGLGIVGALFYTRVNNHFLVSVLGQTIGPYSKTLAEHGFSRSERDVWQRIAARHGVAILVERPGRNPKAYDAKGDPTSPEVVKGGQIHAVHGGPEGVKVTFSWTLTSFANSHLPLMGGLVAMALAVVGSAFWFLQRQLRPLAELQRGVESVARGDFETRVPLVRNDEIGKVAAAFNQMAGQVGEMIEDRERLLADVSHELRSPIARMKVAVELLPAGARAGALTNDLKEMEDLVAVLLERERLRLLDGSIGHEELDLGRAAKEAAATYAGQAPGIELAIEGSATTLRADPGLIKVLLQNLIDNAIKFSLPDSRPILIAVESDTQTSTVRVRDDGQGIPPGCEERILDPFVKLDRARGHGVGYGLGLNLCQRIVELHRGEIRISRRQPRGTEATVTLPRSSPRTQPTS